MIWLIILSFPYDLLFKYYVHKYSKIHRGCVFVEPACGKRDIVATVSNFWVCVRACVRPSDPFRAITSKVIVAFSYKLVKMFIMMSRCVAYKTHNSMSKVNVTLRGQSWKLCNFMPCPDHHSTSYCCIFMKLCGNVHHAM